MRLPHARLLTNALANYAGEITTQLTGILLTPFIIAHLGDSLYGLWVLIVAVQGFGGLFDLGMTTSVVKYVAEHRARDEPEEINRVVSSAFFLHVGIGLLAFLVTAVGARWGLPLLHLTPAQLDVGRPALLIAGASLIFGLPCGVLGSLLPGLREYERANAVNIVQTLGAAGAIVVALITGGGPVALIAINGVAIVAGYLAKWVLARRLLPGLRLSPRLAGRATLRRIGGYSFGLFLLDTATNLFHNADAILIAAFLPVSRITPYTLGQKPASVVSIINRPFATAFLPAASELQAREQTGELQRLLVFGTRGTLLVTVPAALWLLVFGPQILTVWVGPGHMDAVPVLYLFLAVYFVSAAQKPAAIILKGIGRVRALTVTVVVEYALNIALSLILIPRIGVIGAVVGTLIPEAINDLIIVPWLICRALHMSYARLMVQIFGRFLLTTGLAGLLLWLAAPWLAAPTLPVVVLAGLLTVLLFGGCYGLLGTSGDEKRQLGRQLRSLRRPA